MQETGRIIVVPQASLKRMPAAFQEYVTQYFTEQNVLGMPCLVAFGALSLGQLYKKGIAPIHSVDLRRYKQGLRGKSLSEWMDNAAKKGRIWKFSAIWDDGCGGPFED